MHPRPKPPLPLGEGRNKCAARGEGYSQNRSMPTSRPPAPLTLALLIAVLLSLLAIAPVAHAQTLPAYTIEAALDVDRGAVSARQVIRYPNTTGRPLDRVVFRVVAGSVGGLSLQSATVDGQPRDPSLDGSVLDVPLAQPLAPGATVEIELRFGLALPRRPERFGATPRGIVLGYWFPTVAVHRGDWDRRQYVSVGDATFGEVADFDVTFTTSRPVEIAATGRLIERDATHWKFQAQSVRDFAATASPSWAVGTSQVGQTTVTGYAQSEATARWYAGRGAELVGWYGDRFGAYPYPTLSVVEVDLPAGFGGLEYPGLIMMDAQYGGASREAGGSLDVLLAHEIAHQWFYSWVGNDQIDDPWLDEAFATYVPTLFYAATQPESYQAVLNRSIAGGDAGGSADGGVDDFPADGAYFPVVYRKGARFLDGLRTQLGEAAFVDLLRTHVGVHRDRVASPRAFLDLAQAATSANLNPLISRAFSYGAFQYRTPQRWSLEIPEGPLRGSAYIFVGAEFPVARVELWLDGRQLAGGPENAITVDLSGVEAGEYVLLARVLNHEGVVFERARRVQVAA
jgi:hypothetical protein